MLLGYEPQPQQFWAGMCTLECLQQYWEAGFTAQMNGIPLIKTFDLVLWGFCIPLNWGSVYHQM